jgi:hypothetical protein
MDHTVPRARTALQPAQDPASKPTGLTSSQPSQDTARSAPPASRMDHINARIAYLRQQVRPIDRYCVSDSGPHFDPLCSCSVSWAPTLAALSSIACSMPTKLINFPSRALRARCWTSVYAWKLRQPSPELEILLGFLQPVPCLTLQRQAHRHTLRTMIVSSGLRPCCAKHSLILQRQQHPRAHSTTPPRRALPHSMLHPHTAPSNPPSIASLCAARTASARGLL